MDGSRRVTLRNRRFLRKIDPVARKDLLLPDIDTSERMDDLSDSIEPVEAADIPIDQGDELEAAMPGQPTIHSIPDVQPQPLRRSTRSKKQTTKFVARLHGKTHAEE